MNLRGFLNIPRLRNLDDRTHQKMNHRSKHATTHMVTTWVHPFFHQHGDLLKTTWSGGTSALEAIFLLTSFTYSMHSPVVVVMLEDCG